MKRQSKIIRALKASRRQIHNGATLPVAIDWACCKYQVSRHTLWVQYQFNSSK